MIQGLLFRETVGLELPSLNQSLFEIIVLSSAKFWCRWLWFVWYLFNFHWPFQHGLSCQHWNMAGHCDILCIGMHTFDFYSHSCNCKLYHDTVLYCVAAQFPEGHLSSYCHCTYIFPTLRMQHNFMIHQMQSKGCASMFLFKSLETGTTMQGKHFRSHDTLKKFKCLQQLWQKIPQFYEKSSGYIFLGFFL